ncbi:hypothetical protein IC582_014956 [Cucumis melo]
MFPSFFTNPHLFSLTFNFNFMKLGVSRSFSFEPNSVGRFGVCILHASLPLTFLSIDRIFMYLVDYLHTLRNHGKSELLLPFASRRIGGHATDTIKGQFLFTFVLSGGVLREATITNCYDALSLVFIWNKH